MLADVLLKNFAAVAVFSVSYFLNVVEEFRSGLSNPEESVCLFGLSIGRAVMTAVCYIFGFHCYNLRLLMLLFKYFVFLIYCLN